MKYKDIEYGYSRLRNTFVLHKGELVRILDLNNPLEYTIENSKRNLSFAHKNELDLTPVTLGYVNHSDTCCFSSRVPMRRDWRQGLRPNSVNFFTRDKNQNVLYFNRETDVFKLEDTVLNKYPTFQVCVEKVQDYFRSQAFSREFSITENGKVWYKGRVEIGNVEDDRGVKLYQNFNYLTESLVEHKINVC